MRFALRLYTEVTTTVVFFVFMLTFLSAYMLPNKIIEISINSIGEAFIELCMFMTATPLVFLRFKDFLDEEKRKRLAKHG